MGLKIKSLYFKIIINITYERVNTLGRSTMHSTMHYTPPPLKFFPNTPSLEKLLYLFTFSEQPSPPWLFFFQSHPCSNSHSSILHGEPS